MGATSIRNWAAFCEVVGHQEWVADERFADNPSRHRNRPVLIPLIEEVTSGRPMAHWIDALQAAGVPCGAIQDYGQVFGDPHLAAREFFWRAPHATLGEVEQLGSPMRFSATAVVRDHAGPLFGEHSAEVLGQLGYPAAEVDRLTQAGIIVRP